MSQSHGRRQLERLECSLITHHAASLFLLTSVCSLTRLIAELSAKDDASQSHSYAIIAQQLQGQQRLQQPQQQQAVGSTFPLASPPGPSRHSSSTSAAGVAAGEGGAGSTGGNSGGKRPRQPSVVSYSYSYDDGPSLEGGYSLYGEDGAQQEPSSSFLSGADDSAAAQQQAAVSSYDGAGPLPGPAGGPSAANTLNLLSSALPRCVTSVLAKVNLPGHAAVSAAGSGGGSSASGGYGAAAATGGGGGKKGATAGGGGKRANGGRNRRRKQSYGYSDDEDAEENAEDYDDGDYTTSYSRRSSSSGGGRPSRTSGGRAGSRANGASLLGAVTGVMSEEDVASESEPAQAVAGSGRASGAGGAGRGSGRSSLLGRGSGSMPQSSSRYSPSEPAPASASGSGSSVGSGSSTARFRAVGGSSGSVEELDADKAAAMRAAAVAAARARANAAATALAAGSSTDSLNHANPSSSSSSAYAHPPVEMMPMSAQAGGFRTNSSWNNGDSMPASSRSGGSSRGLLPVVPTLLPLGTLTSARSQPPQTGGQLAFPPTAAAPNAGSLASARMPAEGHGDAYTYAINSHPHWGLISKTNTPPPPPAERREGAPNSASSATTTGGHHPRVPVGRLNLSMLTSPQEVTSSTKASAGEVLENPDADEHDAAVALLSARDSGSARAAASSALDRSPLAMPELGVSMASDSGRFPDDLAGGLGSAEEASSVLFGMSSARGSEVDEASNGGGLSASNSVAANAAPKAGRTVLQLRPFSEQPSSYAHGSSFSSSGNGGPFMAYLVVGESGSARIVSGVPPSATNRTGGGSIILQITPRDASSMASVSANASSGGSGSGSNHTMLSAAEQTGKSVSNIMMLTQSQGGPAGGSAGVAPTSERFTAENASGESAEGNGYTLQYMVSPRAYFS